MEQGTGWEIGLQDWTPESIQWKALKIGLGTRYSRYLRGVVHRGVKANDKLEPGASTTE